MSDDLRAFMQALHDGGVSCDDPDGESGWVDDSGECIRAALVKAGWTPPADPPQPAQEEAGRATTRSILPDAPDPDAEAERAKRGFPWCDTCQRPSVANQFFGLSHSTAEYPYGVPQHLDPYGDHDVTHHQWYEARP